MAGFIKATILAERTSLLRKASADGYIDEVGSGLKVGQIDMAEFAMPTPQALTTVVTPEPRYYPPAP